MDWTDIYDNDGLDTPSLPTFNPSLAIQRLVSFAETTEVGYDTRALYIFTINYILGVGCLGMPYGFARSGVIFGSCLVILVTGLAYCTVGFVAETVARAEKLAVLPCEKGSKCWICLSKDCRTRVGGSVCGPIDEEGQVNEEGYEFIGSANRDGNRSYGAMEKVNRRPRSDTDASVDWQGEKSYEVTELCTKFLGPKYRLLYQLCLLSLMFVGLLAYSQVFCNSLLALIDSTAHPFVTRPLLSFVFACLVVPLSCADLEEQVTVQAAMMVARFLAIFVMVAGSVYSICFDGVDSESGGEEAPFFAKEVEPNSNTEPSMNYVFSFDGFGVMFSTALFSQLFQHSVPGLIRPLPELQKPKVKRVFATALFTTASLYLLLGAVSVCYFGSSTLSSINLNFTNFTYGVDMDEAPMWKILLVNSLSNIVVLFPAADTISVFPLIANTLGNNLSTSIPKLPKRIDEFLEWREGSQASLNSYDKKAGKKRRKEFAQKLNTILWRLIASIPPILASVFASDLAFSLQLAGLSGLYVAFVCPTLLQRASINSTTRALGEKEIMTVYSGWQSSRWIELAVLGFSAFSFGVVCWQIKTNFEIMMNQDIYSSSSSKN
ncbi:hypothetical protein TrST_g4009 [Triparma strigata]|uniref:Amino acid transporter transmembrane domain-containing protein n=1 Tax=Triparma strigata TaxID=1606541 RepID=A0A9W7EDG7_9STRA|nr:hypothetical protein TrST_g4009 [Triparma strigata]